MIIDMHAHIGDLRTPGNLELAPITVENLIAYMDAEGIDRSAVLPWPPCPEGVTFPGLFFPDGDVIGQIRAASRRRDRLILFGNADARWGGNSASTDFSWLLERFIEMGCVGMGEVSANLYFDDPRVVNLFRQCGRYRLPMTIESCGPGEGLYGFIDLPGSPHLERLLQEASDTIIIGHGPGFWADIAAGLSPEEKSTYPKGPIAEEGSVPRLLRTYPNLYADLSATSGFNAITRDEAYGIRFLNEFQDKLMFGTDRCFGEARPPHLAHLRGLLSEGRLSQGAFEKIMSGNARRLLRA